LERKSHGVNFEKETANSDDFSDECVDTVDELKDTRSD